MKDSLLLTIGLIVFFLQVGAMVVYYVYDDIHGMVFHGIVAILLWISITKLGGKR